MHAPGVIRVYAPSPRQKAYVIGARIRTIPDLAKVLTRKRKDEKEVESSV